MVFNSSLTSSASNRYSILSKSIITNKGHVTQPPYTRFYPLNSSSLEIHTFSKYGAANIDMLRQRLSHRGGVIFYIRLNATHCIIVKIKIL